MAFDSDDSDDIHWLDPDVVAEVTLVCGGRRISRPRGIWSSDSPGEQMIEMRFHEPMSISMLRIISSELQQSRTQEMTVWASLHRGEQHREVVRQQFNFSPFGATEEIEQFVVELDDVSAIQLRIVPSIDGRRAVARVNGLWLACEVL
jgi:hypothetical protein